LKNLYNLRVPSELGDIDYPPRVADFSGSLPPIPTHLSEETPANTPEYDRQAFNLFMHIKDVVKLPCTFDKERERAPCTFGGGQTMFLKYCATDSHI
jgi:hypothetical protein